MGQVWKHCSFRIPEFLCISVLELQQEEAGKRGHQSLAEAPLCPLTYPFRDQPRPERASASPNTMWPMGSRLFAWGSVDYEDTAHGR